VHHHLERRLEAGLANIHTDDGLFLTMPDTLCTTTSSGASNIQADDGLFLTMPDTRLALYATAAYATDTP